MTLRQHALRMTAEPLCRSTWRSTSCSGPTVDRPIDRWAEMFLPEELARGLARRRCRRRRDAPLVVGAPTTLFAARRPPPLRGAARGARRRFCWSARWFGLLHGGAGGGRRAQSVGARPLRRRARGLGPGRRVHRLLPRLRLGCSPITSWRTATRTSCCARPGRSRSPGSASGVAVGRPGATRKALAGWRRRRSPRRSRRSCIKLGVAPRQDNARADRVLPAGLAGRHGGLAARRPRR